MSKHNAFRAGKVHVKARPCSTCIFHRGNKMQLAEGRVEQMVADAERNESAIICHSTLGTKANAVCRGFFDEHSTLPLRLARMFGNIKEV